MRLKNKLFLILAGLVVLGIIVSLFTFTTAQNNNIKNGDVNGDGSIDLSDAVYILLYLFEGGPKPVSAGSVGDTGTDYIEIYGMVDQLGRDNYQLHPIEGSEFLFGNTENWEVSHSATGIYLIIPSNKIESLIDTNYLPFVTVSSVNVGSTEPEQDIVFVVYPGKTNTDEKRSVVTVIVFDKNINRVDHPFSFIVRYPKK